MIRPGDNRQSVEILSRSRIPGKLSCRGNLSFLASSTGPIALRRGVRILELSRRRVALRLLSSDNSPGTRTHLQRLSKWLRIFPRPRSSSLRRHHFGGPSCSVSLTVRECRAVKDLIPSVMDTEQPLLVIDLTAGLEECLQWLAEDFTRYPKSVPMIAVGSAESRELEWLLREAGVTVYLPELIGGEALARICRRQLDLRIPSPFANTRHRS